jgi:uncharacterized protein (DUF2236 family)
MDVDRREDVVGGADGVADLPLATDGDGRLVATRDPDPLRAFDETVTLGDVPPDVAALVRSRVDDPDEGFFGPGSATWEVSRENTLFLCGPTTILLQIAHPKVGAALADHSTLQDDYYTRLHDTFDIIDTVAFGDVTSAVRASVIVRKIHERVTGRVDDDVGPFEAGETYYANDPELMCWIAATLIDQALTGYETYVGSLSDETREAYYRESRIFYRLLGIPADTLPETLEGFYDYYERTLAEEITIGPDSDAVASGFLGQFTPEPLVRTLAAGTMPDRGREAYDLRWGSARRGLFGGFARLVRAVPKDLLPDRYRYREKYREFDRV